MAHTTPHPDTAASQSPPPLGDTRAPPPRHRQPPHDGATPAPETAVVPERPALAPTIVLSGTMTESGFAEPQWIIQRDGQFIQLTELLYRVAEQIDGQRDLAAIAQRMSATINRDVTADNVRQLIASKLIPLGIVVQADGTVAGTGSTEGVARSPLKINLKTKVLPRGLITPLTNVLKVLYYPPVLIAVLIASLATQGWLFFVHGVAGSVRDAVYKPWLMLALLGVIILVTAFHEFGHAAALEYGGGKVRGMGMGFYLVYPAFYTDVTDNYRLGRWARVRTDLGGFYFNLVFALALVGLYALTKQEFLLLPIVLIDFEIVHQSLPFVRLDGYWTLADLTGIPDLFSYIGPFVRRMFPFLPGKKREMPELKRWVKIVFGAYILITLPVLALLLFLLLKGVPRILATAWDSMRQQGSALSGAWQGSEYLGAVSAAVQMLLLALPVAGLGFTLFALGKNTLTRLWTWSRPTPARRVVGAFSTAALAAALAVLWLPGVPSLPWQRGGNAQSVAAQDRNWRPIVATERGTVADALPPAVPVPFRSPAPVATDTPPAIPAGTAAPATDATPGASQTPGATGTLPPTGTPGGTTIPTASGTPGATSTPGGTGTPGTTSAPGAATAPAVTIAPPLPTSVPARAPQATAPPAASPPTTPVASTAPTAPTAPPVAPPAPGASPTRPPVTAPAATTITTTPPAAPTRTPAGTTAVPTATPAP